MNAFWDNITMNAATELRRLTLVRITSLLRLVIESKRKTISLQLKKRTKKEEEKKQNAT